MKKIISLDGGGIRGVVTAVILEEIEERMQSLITDKVDLAAGTSTGSIVAGAISTGIPMGNLVKFYKEQGPVIFRKNDFKHRIKTLGGLNGPKYNEKELYDALDYHFGGALIKDGSTNFLSTAYNMSEGRPRFFSTHQEGHMKFSDVIAASSSAPTYFKPKTIEGKDYIDGGVFCANPAVSALAEMKSNNKNLKADDIFMLSVGTGSRALGYSNTKKWSKFKWISPLIDLMMSSDAGVAHYQLVQTYNSINKRDNYFRLNANLPKNISRDMDNADPDNMNLLIEFAESIIKKNDRKLNIIAERLK